MKLIKKTFKHLQKMIKFYKINKQLKRKKFFY